MATDIPAAPPGAPAATIPLPARYAIECRDIVYRDDADGKLLARLYRPVGPGPCLAGPFPALIEVHGGAWTSGDRFNNTALDTALAQDGIVVLAIEFRMPPAHPYPAAIADINLATRWFKAHAGEFGSRADLVGGLGTSSGGHQLILSAMRPHDPRYAALPLADAPTAEGGIDASLRHAVLCWSITDPLARYRMAGERGITRLVEAHHAYFPSPEAMSEGNPCLALERGEPARLPPLLLIQGTDDDNVTPDMADRFAAAYRARGGRGTLEKFAGAPHAFIARHPTSEAAQRATLLIRGFVHGTDASATSQDGERVVAR